MWLKVREKVTLCKIENRTRKRTLETKEPNLKNFSNSSEIMTKAVKKIL